MVTALRGPLEADRFRTTRYRQRWYRDPLGADDTFPERKGKDDILPAFSTVKRVHKGTFRKRYGDQTYDLDALRCALFVADQKEHLLRIDDDSIVAAVAQRPAIVLNQAGNRGTGVHAMFEALAKDQAIDRDWVEVYHPDSLDYYDVVMRFWEEQLPVIGFEEVVGMNWEAGYACTGDAAHVRFTGPGTPSELKDKLIVQDYKSRGPDSNHGCYEVEAMQLAAMDGVEYAFIQRDDGAVVRHIPERHDVGVIISIRPDSYELYPVDLAKAWDGWVDTCDAWRFTKSGAKAGRQACGDALFVQVKEADALATVTAIFPGAEVVEDPFAGLPDEDGTPQPDLAKMTTWLRDRAIALDGIIPAWPSDVPTFKAMAGELHSLDQLKAIEKAIEKAEAAAGTPFPDDDPYPVAPKDDPRVLALVEKVGAMNEAQREAYVVATKGIVGAKPTTGLCRYEHLEQYEAAAEVVLHSGDADVERAMTVPEFSDLFRRNDSGWVVDHPAVVLEIFKASTGANGTGKREFLKAARALSPDVTIPNADAALKDAGLVAKILLEGE